MKPHRRNVLQTLGGGLGLGVTGALAGCGNDSDGNDAGEGDPSETVFKTGMNRSYSTLQANIKAAQTSSPAFPSWYSEHYMSYNHVEDDYGTAFLDAVDVEGSTMSVSIVEDSTWHNGDPVTAEDVLTQFKLLAMTGNDPRLGTPDTWAGFDGIRTTGEYSIEVDLAGEFNPRLTIMNSFGPVGRTPVLWTPAAVFGRFVESFGDATTDEEREAARAALTEFSWSYEEAYGNGLWKVDDIGSTQITLSLFEDHRAANAINFETVRFRPIENGVPALRNQELDMGSQVDPGTPLPENFERVDLDIAERGGPALMFDHQHDIYGRTAFKQAIAFLIDKRQVVQVTSPEMNQPGPGNNALHRKFEDRYLTSPIEGSLIEYGVESKPERARERLESIGFTRDDDTWYDDNDEPLEMEINTPSTTWATIANTISGQLEQFGITANVLTEEASTFFSKYSNKTYPTPIEYWSGGTATPYAGFKRNMTGFGGDTMDYPAEVEAPPVGEPNGDLQTYDVQAMLDAALEASTDEAFVSAIHTLAWVQNYELPCISLQLAILEAGTVFDAEGWTFPEPDSKQWAWAYPFHWHMIHGNFQAR